MQAARKEDHTMSMDIPKIAITQEAEEDDDNNQMSFSEVLTDVEDLYEETVRNHIPKNRRKLRIKLTRDEYLTDLEDFEASDDEDMNRNIVEHAEPMSMDNLDLEGEHSKSPIKRR
ncbi:hypothetical protein JTB14_038266 [Gonioctena quinquepunctata]|nr:hypothetical protein JTB14_038266 [Gonioctena quinquepunctata]